jgi:rubrerythrin
MSKKFQKKVEDFVCEHCNFAVLGNGYTNHCPRCLWSKHVDINPGDRASVCGGMMKPVRVEKIKKGYTLIHLCEQCGYEKPNKVSPNDDFDVVVSVSKKVS